jgi:hypothetical protein
MLAQQRQTALRQSYEDVVDTQVDDLVEWLSLLERLQA